MLTLRQLLCTTRLVAAWTTPTARDAQGASDPSISGRPSTNTLYSSLYSSDSSLELESVSRDSEALTGREDTLQLRPLPGLSPKRSEVNFLYKTPLGLNPGCLSSACRMDWLHSLPCSASLPLGCKTLDATKV